LAASVKGVALALAGASIVALANFTAPAAANAASHTIVIEGVRYEPATLTIKRGDSVTWVNKDPYPHTATASGTFDSRSIAANRSWTFTARNAGRYDYVCTLHPNMKATLIVE